MESLYFLVPCALIFIGLAIKVMFWAINNGQYDNLDTEAHRILFDADEGSKPQVNPVQADPIQAKPLQSTPTQRETEQATSVTETPDAKNPHA